MNFETNIVTVTEDVLDKYPQVICFTNEKHPYHHIKLDWIRKQYKYGLKIKLLFIKEEKKPVGFIEYIPGEYCWRSVNAKGYMFIHCLWTNGKKYQHKGLGSILIDEVEKDAKDMLGVALITSDKAFMVNKKILLKKGYKIVSTAGKEQLMVKQFKKAELPKMNNWEEQLKKINDLTFIFSVQCPWVARFMEDVKPVLEEMNLKPKIIRITDHKQAQNAPTIYSVFNLIYKGRILADRNISITRFRNIMKKEILSE